MPGGWITWLVAGLLVGIVVVRLLQPKGPQISGQEARALVADGALLVDVRSPAEFGGGHLPGAVNIPVGEIAGRLGELGDKDQPIVVYCRSGARSTQAQDVLKNAGYGEVHNLGGIGNW